MIQIHHVRQHASPFRQVVVTFVEPASHHFSPARARKEESAEKALRCGEPHRDVQGRAASGTRWTLEASGAR
jgi:hypothetical protein